MKQGNLEERVLSRSVLKHIGKANKDVRQKAAVGQDFAEIGGMVSADGMHEDPFLAWTKARNNFACSGGAVVSARLLCLLPADTEEPEIKAFMACFEKQAAREQIQIAGGQTVIDLGVSAPRFYVTLLGMTDNYRQREKEIKPGFSIVMTKETGLLGTNLLLQKQRDRLEEHFSKLYLSTAGFAEDAYSILPEARAAAVENKVYYMHDVSGGGVYSALWQMSVRMKKGIRIYHADIPIRQETIEICEYFNRNPYLIDGSGSLLCVCEDGQALCDMLHKQGICATEIGQVADNQDKVIVVGEDTRYLTLPEGNYDI
ncbi:MAG: AIR synthase-related protein [Wujia sp.]